MFAPDKEALSKSKKLPVEKVNAQHRRSLEIRQQDCIH